jgi:hypothetical protein
VAPRFLTILTGRNLPKIGQPREAEPSIINEDDRGFYARGRGRRESWSASHGLVKVRARLLMRVKLKILLFCVRGQRLASFLGVSMRGSFNGCIWRWSILPHCIGSRHLSPLSETLIFSTIGP